MQSHLPLSLFSSPYGVLWTKIYTMSVNKEVKKITTNTLLKMKQAGEKISMITAYDFSFAKIFDAAGIDLSS